MYVHAYILDSRVVCLLFGVLQIGSQFVRLLFLHGDTHTHIRTYICTSIQAHTRVHRTTHIKTPSLTGFIRATSRGQQGEIQEVITSVKNDWHGQPQKGCRLWLPCDVHKPRMHRHTYIHTYPSHEHTCVRTYVHVPHCHQMCTCLVMRTLPHLRRHSHYLLLQLPAKLSNLT